MIDKSIVSFFVSSRSLLTWLTAAFRGALTVTDQKRNYRETEGLRTGVPHEEGRIGCREASLYYQSGGDEGQWQRWQLCGYWDQCTDLVGDWLRELVLPAQGPS